MAFSRSGNAISPGLRWPRRMAGSGGMTIFSLASSKSFSRGAAFPAAMARFLCFLLYRFRKYIPKPINQAMKTSPPHILPAIIGVFAFLLHGAKVKSKQRVQAGYQQTFLPSEQRLFRGKHRRWWSQTTSHNLARSPVGQYLARELKT